MAVVSVEGGVVAIRAFSSYASGNASMPLPISADLYSAALEAALPITPSQRNEFLAELATELARAPELGPGVLHRAAAVLQRKFVVEARSTAGSFGELRHLERERKRLVREL
jgi:hypothetical protein